MKLEDYTYEGIAIGKKFSFQRTLTSEDIASFAALTEDTNPLHCDESYARHTPFKKPVAHGMLAAGLFSALVGMVCPGRRCLYLSQTLQFKKPVFPGTPLTILGMVTGKNDSVKLITIHTQILAQDTVLIDGEAKVTLIPESSLSH
ncbi:MAG: MaoC family dehydratase [Nanoarchaeota archaeon]|nr:MaoC family dehydratase [Nanoarchaeota archaeon]